MPTLGIIPARFASTRFPGKPLVVIKGKTMIQRVYEQASLCSLLDKVVVATEDQRIFNHVCSFGGKVLLTSDFHKSGTDRCAEVVGFSEFSHFETVVNIQGDEPMIHPFQIGKVISFLNENSGFNLATLAKKLGSEEEWNDPNTVKVVFDKTGRALYFSRSPIPFVRQKEQPWPGKDMAFRHIGLYGYRRETLLEIAKLEQSDLEKLESLEQLRWMENGFAIGVQLTEYESFGIDVPEDLKKIKL